MGIARIVGTMIVTLVFLVILTSILNFFILQVLNDYVMGSFLDEQTIQQSWNASVSICESLKPADANWTCEERLAQYSLDYGIDLNYTGYTSSSPFVPFKNGWFATAFNSTYILVMVALSIIFTGIAEAGGWK